MSFPRAVAKLTNPIRRRVLLMIGRAVVRLVDDAGGLQRVQVTALAGETRDAIERVQNYGVSSRPLAGAEAVIVCVGGNRDHPVAIAVDDRRHRKAGLQPGEVAIYTDEGDYIHLKRGRVVEIVTDTLIVKASTKVRFETPLVEATGEIIDRVDAAGRSMSGMREIFNQHVHPENDNGGPTEAPSEGM